MRFVLTLLLLIPAAPAWADWVKVGKSETTVLYVMSEEIVYYIDLSSIARAGNFSRVWEIHDRSDKGPRGERSLLTQVEYDCAEKQMRTVRASGLSQRMAKGQIVYSGGAEGDWLLIPKGRNGEVFFKILNMVCGP